MGKENQSGEYAAGSGVGGYWSILVNKNGADDSAPFFELSKISF